MGAAHDTTPDSLNLISHAGKALRHGVMDFMSQPLALLGDREGFPLLDTEVDKLSQQGQNQHHREQYFDMPRCPPRWSLGDGRMLYRCCVFLKLQIVGPSGSSHTDVAPH